MSEDTKEIKCPFCEDELIEDGECSSCGFKPSDPEKVHIFMVCGGPGGAASRIEDIDVVKMTERCLMKPSEETIFVDLAGNNGFSALNFVFYLGTEEDQERFITKLKTASVMKE